MARSFGVLVACVLAASCGGGGGGGDSPPPPPAFTVGGTVTGLVGSGLTLRNNAGAPLAVNANGAFTFSGTVASGSGYNVTVATQPAAPAQICQVGGGSGTVTANVASISVTCTFAVGFTVSGLSGTGLVLENNGGDQITVNANGAGAFSSGIASGAAYNVTVRTQPTASPPQICAASSGTGTAGNATINVAVTCVLAKRFVYVAAAAPDGVAAFEVDASTGSLAPIAGSPFATTGSSPQVLFADRTKKFLYVYGDNDVNAPGGTTITGFSLNAQTGALTPIPSLIVNFPASASPVAMHPSGNFFYVPVSEGTQTANNRLHAFAINPTTGELAAIGGSPYAAPGNEVVHSAVLSPNGASLYLASSIPPSAGSPPTGRIRQYSVDPATGQLSIAPPPSEHTIAGNSAYQLFMHPAGTHMYSRNSTSPYHASRFVFEPATGAFLGSSRADYPLGFGFGVIIAPSDKIYFPVLGGIFGAPAPGSVVGWLDGGPQFAGSPYPTNGSNSLAATLDPTGRFIALTNLGSHTVSVMRIDPLPGQGGLTHVAGSPFTPAVGTAPGSATYDPSLPFAYLTDAQTRSISSYVIDAATGVPAFVDSEAMLGLPGVSQVTMVGLQ